MSKRTKVFFCILFCAIVMVFFGIVIFNQLKVGDFQPHIEWARKLGSSGYLWLRANTLFQRLVLVTRDLLPFNFFARISKLAKQIIDIKSYDISALIVTIAAYLVSFIGVVKYFKQSLVLEENKRNTILVYVLGLITLIVGPIILFSYPGRQYIGSINGNPFHNPTYTLMKPFAIFFFIFTINSLYKKVGWKEVLLSGLILFLASIAKPNFTLSFIPSVGFVAIFLNFKRLKELNWKFFTISIVFVSLFALITQYIIMYSGTRGDRVLFSPFTAIMAYLPDLPTIIGSILLSIVFPILIIIVYWKKVKNQLSLTLVLVNFVISFVISYSFMEQVDMLSLNFLWTIMFATFLLFMESIRIFVQEGILEFQNNNHKIMVKHIILGSMLLLHLVCGILFYFSSLSPISPVRLVN